jgi:hypothetical protein
VAQVIEVPELESWFLLHWRSPELPDVLMEFETQDQAEDALAAAFAEMTIRLDDGTAHLPITVCSVLTMLQDETLRTALAAWDAQLEELDATVRRTVDEMSPGAGPRSKVTRRRPPSG